MNYYDVKESAKKQIGSNNRTQFDFQSHNDSDNSDAHVQWVRGDVCNMAPSAAPSGVEGPGSEEGRHDISATKILNC